MNRSNTALWLSNLAPPVSALIAQLVMYAWVPSACHEGTVFPIHVTFAAASLIALCGLVVATLAHRANREAALVVVEAGDVRPPERVAFMALGGIGLSSIALVVDIAMWIAALGHHPCDS